MYTEEMYAEQRIWASRALELMRDLLPLVGAFANSPALELNEKIELGNLMTAAARSTESSFMLMAYGQLWDAEVLVRSVFEASLKFAYIVQSPADFKQRFTEYSEDMFQLAVMKDDQKAREVLAVLPDADSPEWKPLRDLVLSDEAREELRSRFDKPTRRAMETRWGYAGLISSLKNSGDTIYKSVSALSHGYAIASHIHHADSVGVSIAMDRDLRSAERRDTAHMAHLARLISDGFTCFQLRLMAAYRFANCSFAPLNEATKKIEKLRDDMALAHSRWLNAEYGYPMPAN